jgi:hypothetical protein
MYDNAPYPSFQGSFAPVLKQLGKYFYKTFLQHILRILPVFGKAVAYTQHAWTVTGIQGFLCSSIIFQTSGQHQLFRHIYALIYLIKIDNFMVADAALGIKKPEI